MFRRETARVRFQWEFSWLCLDCPLGHSKHFHVSETNSRALAGQILGHGENNDTDVVKAYVSKKISKIQICVKNSSFTSSAVKFYTIVM